jgi:hypothetical protein
VCAGQGGGPVLWDFIFFLATVPMALSAVYKQIAFESVDLDVWWLNGWVAVFQFVVGLTYAPLAAVMTGLPTDQIRGNIWDGLRCFIMGTNFITTNCEIGPLCGTALLPCCDSCDGSIPSVSASASAVVPRRVDGWTDVVPHSCGTVRGADVHGRQHLLQRDAGAGDQVL